MGQLDHKIPNGGLLETSKYTSSEQKTLCGLSLVSCTIIYNIVSEKVTH